MENNPKQIINIVHIAPNETYNEDWGYQINLLPKYQRLLGHNVTVVVSGRKFQDNAIIQAEAADYYTHDGIHVIRRDYKELLGSNITHLLSYLPVEDILIKNSPDLIFCHGLLSYSIIDAIKYKKRHRNTVIVQDNHMDYYNSSYYISNTLRTRLIKIWYCILNKRTIRYVSKVYGVTPWRKEFAEDYFQISKSKTDVLIMGAEDKCIDFDNKNKIKRIIRNKYGLHMNDFVIVSGGKLDKAKNIHLLIDAVERSKKNIKLLIFGSADKEIETYLNESIDGSEKIRLAGWIESDKVYEYFFAADLIVFPGTHSVLWEQACACKVPCVFKRWKGMNHVDVGGNAKFLEKDSVGELSTIIESLFFTKQYFNMLDKAQSDLTDVFLYSSIAKKSIECVKQEE